MDRTQLMQQIQRQMDRIRDTEKELNAEGYTISQKYLTPAKKMPGPRTSDEDLADRLKTLKDMNKTDMKRNATKFTWTHETLNEKTGEITKGKTYTLRKNFQQRAAYIVNKLKKIHKRSREIKGRVPQSLFDITDDLILRMYTARVVNNQDGGSLDGTKYGYIDADEIPIIQTCLDEWNAYKDQYKGAEGTPEWATQISNTLNQIQAEIRNMEPKFDSADYQEMIALGTKVYRLITKRPVPAGLGYAGDEISPIGTPYETDKDEDENGGKA